MFPLHGTLYTHLAQCRNFELNRIVPTYRSNGQCCPVCQDQY